MASNYNFCLVRHIDEFLRASQKDQRQTKQSRHKWYGIYAFVQHRAMKICKRIQRFFTYVTYVRNAFLQNLQTIWIMKNTTS